MRKVFILLLVLVLLLPGCSVPQERALYDNLPYSHPDMAAFDQVLSESCAVAESSYDISEV